VVSVGANLVDYSLSFSRAGSYEDTPGEDLPYAGQAYPTVENNAKPAIGVGGMQAIPLLVVASDLGGAVPGLRVALGVMAPNAYPGRDFGEYEFEAPGVAPPPQRYDMIEQEAATALPSLAASYSIGDKIDVGARVSWGIADIKAVSYTWAIPNYTEWVGEDSEFSMDVSDHFVPAFGAGALYRPMDNLELGAAYSSAVNIHAKGTGAAILGAGQFPDEIVPLNPAIAPACAAGGVPGALKACVDLTLPQTAAVGARWSFRDGAGNERADVELDVKWEDWSAGSDYEIIVDGQSMQNTSPLRKVIIRHGFQDVWSVRLGGAYKLPMGEREVTVRGGVAHDTAAAPKSWQRVDVDGAARTTMALGASYTAARWRLDVAGALVVEPDRTVEACNPDVANPGCPPGAGSVAVQDRESPDPAQPLFEPALQFESPFNGGDYSSGYLMLSLGFTTWF
jgi:hypothetical protein